MIVPWYVVYTKFKSELKVVEVLKNQGIKTYCPVITQLKQYSDRRKKVQTPLISRYVFVNIPENKREDVFVTSLIERYVFWLGKPAVVRDSEIVSMQENLQGIVHDVSFNKLSEGDSYKIDVGPFRGKEGSVVQKEKNKVKLLLRELGFYITLNFTD